MSECCYHCELPLEQTVYYTEVMGATRKMCCPGCQAVAEAIVSNGLQDYYRFRTEPGEKADIDILQSLQALEVYDEASVQEEFVLDQGANKQIQLSIEGISCAACGWLIEKALSKTPGIQQVAVNVAARRALISWKNDTINLSQILQRIEKIGYKASPFQADQQELLYQKEQKRYLKRLGLAGLMTMQVMMLAIGLYFGFFGSLDNATLHYFHWVSLLLTTPVVLYAGAGFYSSAFKALSNKSLNMDVPISVAVWLTFLASGWSTFQGQTVAYYESVCMFIFLLLISRYLEHNGRHKATLASANMLKHIPLTANVVVETGEIQSALAKKLNVGDRVLVKNGELIPIDGTVISGQAWVDESMLSGEFAPLDKTIGSRVYGGTLNQQGSIEIEVAAPFKNALINQIVRMQEQALADKPAIASMADKLAQYFVFVVLVVSAATFAYWQYQSPNDALWITVSVLVATCPCALGLATPSALSCAMARLNRLGVLLKKGDLLEVLTQIDTLMLDKTGTLTEGHFSLDRQICLTEQYNKKQLLAMAAALEQHSEHPLSKVFTPHFDGLQANDVEVVTGGGIKGNLDGQSLWIGSAHFVPVTVPPAHRQASVFLSTRRDLLAVFYVSDQIKSDADSLFEALPKLKVQLLSGDSLANVRQVADTLGIADYLATQRPQDKLHHIQQLQDQGHKVMMMGDGVNDAPVLAAANVSVAVTNASDIAKNAADILLLNTGLKALPELLSVAKGCKQKIKQNFAWALGYNLLVLPLAVCGLLSPWLAVIGMSLSSIIVVTNSSRLLK